MSISVNTLGSIAGIPLSGFGFWAWGLLFGVVSGSFAGASLVAMLGVIMPDCESNSRLSIFSSSSLTLNIVAESMFSFSTEFCSLNFFQ